MIEKKIVFRCNANVALGWGHVMRCLTLAQWLQGKHKIYFVINQNSIVCEYIKSRGFAVFEISEKGEPDKVQERVLNTIFGFEPHLVINDIQDTTQEYMQSIKAQNIKMINFDDTTNNVKMAACLIDANRKEKEGKCFGPKYIVLPSIYAKQAKKTRRIKKKVRSIGIAMGGSDPNNLTEKTLRSLNEKVPDSIELIAVIGPGFENKEALLEWENKGNISFLEGIYDLSEFFLTVDIAIVNGGITMYESLCLGTPTLVLAQNKPQAKNARRMEKHSAVFYLGEGAKISDKKVIRKTNALIESLQAREKLSNKAKSVIDGKGIFRALEQIEMCL